MPAICDGSYLLAPCLGRPEGKRRALKASVHMENIHNVLSSDVWPYLLASTSSEVLPVSPRLALFLCLIVLSASHLLAIYPASTTFA